MMNRWKSVVVHAGLLAGLLLSIFPFYWLAVMATRTTSEIYSFPPRLWFGGELGANISRVMASIDFWGAFFNTLFVASAVTVLVLFSIRSPESRSRNSVFPAANGCLSYCSPP
ncbi:hypothetical protein PACILC2_17180 [Paenibacillus cisolokensis]|uniref:ABC transmembrane type-1 domain-containing protein n=1 Tax=Paenibacillus cisolokensis TaxID=1658519 RepID=A0ABQ4N4N2_9BACL|nr:hypothetical protein PACILC2_17180 [Paenibacillus cisolokensis]